MIVSGRILVRIFILGLILISLISVPAYAQVGIVVDLDKAVLNFPDSIVFSLQVHGSVDIDQVQLIYHTNARSCLSSSAHKALDITPGQTVTVEWTWDLEHSSNLPPGAVVTWQWQVSDTAGGTLLTPEKTFTVEDPNYAWQKTQSGNITVYWSEGGAAFGDLILQTAISSLERVAKEFAITKPEAARLMVYPGSSQLRKAVLHVPSWAGGLAFPEYGTIMMGIAPQQTDYVVSIVPHELAHMLVDQRIDNCVGSYLPTWLSEGLAVYAEGPISSRYQDIVAQALAQKEAFLLTDLAGGFPSSSDRADLAYAQSGMVVSYLIKAYGSPKLDALFDKIKLGTTSEAALIAVYALDTAGIDQAWRASQGYGSMPPTLAAATPTTRAVRTAVPTLSLYTAAPAVSATPTAVPSASQAPTLAATPTPTPVAAALPPTAAALTLPPASAPLSAGNGGFPLWGWLLVGGGVLLLAAFAVVWMTRKQ